MPRSQLENDKGGVMAPETLINQSIHLSDIIQQLNGSLASLDMLGFALAAVHVHNAIAVLEIENDQSKLPTVLNPTGCAEFARLDRMASTLFT